MNKNNFERKKRLGQYFTEGKVAKLLATLANESNAKKVIDPMCGRGDMLSVLSSMNNNSRKVGIDIDPMAVRNSPYFNKNNSNIEFFVGNAFNWKTLKQLDSLCFDLVITNPPYVRYQSLSTQGEGDIVLPDSTSVKSGLFEILTNIKSLSANDKRVFRQIIKSYSGLADLAVPSWILCAMLTSVGGHLAMVVPETWLTRDYAHPIHYLLLKLFKIKWVIEDESRSWFRDAQVKTNLIIAERIPLVQDLWGKWKNEKYLHITLTSKHSNSVSLVGSVFPDSTNPDEEFLNLLEDIKSGISKNEGAEVLVKSYLLRARLNDLFSSSFNTTWFKNCEPSLSTQKDKFYFSRQATKLPQEFIEIIGSEKMNVCTLENVCWKVGQGLRTGANNFFYCSIIEEGDCSSIVRTDKTLGLRQISVPKDSLIPVIRKQSEINDSFLLRKRQLTGRLFFLENYVHPKDIEVNPEVLKDKNRKVMPSELQNLIDTASTVNIGTVGKPKYIPSMSAVRTNIRRKKSAEARFWYMLPPLTLRHRPNIFIPRVNNLQPKAILNMDNTVVDANFSTLWLTQKSVADKYAMLAFLNSTWTKAYAEIAGSVMGGGALKLEATQIRRLPVPVMEKDEWKKLSLLGQKILTKNENQRLLNEINQIIFEAITNYEVEDYNLASIINEFNKLANQRLIARNN